MTANSSSSPLVPAVIEAVAALVVVGSPSRTGVTRLGRKRPSAALPPPIANPTNANAQGPTVADIYEKVSPGVVFIQSEGVSAEEPSPFGGPDGGQGVAEGSGFVLDDQGDILTNAH